MRGWDRWGAAVCMAYIVVAHTGCATLLALQESGSCFQAGGNAKVAPEQPAPAWDPAAPPFMLTIGYDQAFVEATESLERWPTAWIRAAGPGLPEEMVAGHAYQWRDVPAIEPVSHPDRVICSLFGLRGRRMHNGLDIKAPRRSPVVATAHGRVVKSGWVRGYGRLVVLDHGGGVQTLYAHLQKHLVEEGDLVVRGQQIGEVGATGRATCAHVHYEVRINGEPVDPIDYVPRKLAQHIE